MGTKKRVSLRQGKNWMYGFERFEGKNLIRNMVLLGLVLIKQ